MSEPTCASRSGSLRPKAAAAVGGFRNHGDDAVHPAPALDHKEAPASIIAKVENSGTVVTPAMDMPSSPAPSTQYPNP